MLCVSAKNFIRGNKNGFYPKRLQNNLRSNAIPRRKAHYDPSFVDEIRDGYDKVRRGDLEYDAVIVGGGHNGLVAACTLANEGKKVAVFERRGIIGGAAVTEEIFPGYKFSRASYVCSLLHPRVISEMGLKTFGLEFLERSPSSFTPTSDSSGKYLMLGPNPEWNKKQIAKFSQKDAEKYDQYEEEMGKIVDLIQPLIEEPPVDPSYQFPKKKTRQLKWERFLSIFAMARRMYPFIGSVSALIDFMTTPAKTVLDRWFESDILKATLATDAVIGSTNPVDAIGSGYVLLHHVMGSIDGERGKWAYVRGGMGEITRLMEVNCNHVGVEVFKDSPVKRIIVEDNKAKGIELEDGRKISSRVVLSNATPEVTFKKLLKEDELPKDFLEKVSRIDYSSGVVKINVALTGLPNFKVLPNNSDGKPGPQHRGTIHFVRSIKDIQDAHADYLSGIPSRRPVIEMTIPSSLDNTLAPEGHHVASLFVQYAPYHLKGKGAWEDSDRDQFCKTVFDLIDEYAPGFSSLVKHREVLAPPDLERIFGLTGGNIFHGAVSLPQLYFNRPVMGGYSRHNTPIEGLWLCGSGSHPGGGVTGLPGRNCAREVASQLSILDGFK
eukprot:TRINITY_DN8736_c0_g1_i1.p1 TRINITY_DN8736_c0_g1~~TRINITY_DN8736_c0_g1_i1.p1  ORF type:complete len:607 (+),score=254.82 TRINITY_DN8736_c0_g1_i1:123-1943(+)